MTGETRRIGVIADLHLLAAGQGLAGLGFPHNIWIRFIPRVEPAVMRAQALIRLERIIAIFQQEGVQTVLLLGDLAESRESQGEIRSTIDEAGLEIISACPGNHEYDFGADVVRHYRETFGRGGLVHLGGGYSLLTIDNLVLPELQWWTRRRVHQDFLDEELAFLKASVKAAEETTGRLIVATHLSWPLWLLPVHPIFRGLSPKVDMVVCGHHHIGWITRSFRITWANVDGMELLNPLGSLSYTMVITVPENGTPKASRVPLF